MKVIVSTPFVALKAFEAYITSAKTVNEFIQGILNGLKNQTDSTLLQSRVKMKRGIIREDKFY